MSRTYTVFPTNKHKRATPPTKILLHGLDQLSAPIQIRNHRFYHRPTNTNTTFDVIIDKLKSALAEALELYPPVAGTVLENEKGELYIAIEPDHLLGTPFLVDLKATPYAVDTEELSPRSTIVLPPKSSILAVKVIQFSCGTIAVTSSINHQVADLCGFLDFLELWAQIARGEAVDFTRIPDDWTRTPGRFFSGLKRDSTLPIYPPPFTVLPAPEAGPPACLLAPSHVSRWKFTKDSMEQLKKDFSPPSENKADWISTGDALAALLCGVITRARHIGNVPRLQGRSSLESQTEIIAMAADGRERAPKGLMAGGKYFGNFNTLWSATVSRSDLASLTCSSASRVALTIRKELTVQLSPEAIANKISFFEAPENIRPPGRISWSADIILTNWCRFDLQGPKLDFGWGKPFYATPGAGGILPPGYCLMLQEKDSGDIYVLMTVEQEGAQGLKADSLLNKYASLVS